jgi:hypothetical protein
MSIQKTTYLILFACFWLFPIWSQEDNYSNAYKDSEDEEVYLMPENDPSTEGQRFFVEELLDIAGYVPERIQVYQTLPNKARVFRVRFDSINGAFVFVRWDKKNKENYVDNKMIDPGVYYNLKVAREVMRRQTDQASFGVEDAAMQAPDQESVSGRELQDLREQYKLDQEERKLKESQQGASKRTPRMGRQRRLLKKKKKKN